MRKRMRMNWKKGIIAMMAALFMAMAVAEPVPAQAAAKVTVKVKSPKKGAVVSGSRLTAHTKKPIQLTVKAPVTKTVKQKVGWKLGVKDGQYVQVPVYKKVKKTVTGDVTAKAIYKTSNKKVVSVSKKGKLTVKKNGNATITVKYKGVSKKIKTTVAANHNWKAHKKTKTVREAISVCNCGVILSDLDEHKYCPICAERNKSCAENNICMCKARQHSIDHMDKGEPSNNWIDYRNKKVTYVDYYYCDCGARKAGEPEPKDTD